MPNRVSHKRSIGVIGICAASCIVSLQGCTKSESTPPPTANPEATPVAPAEAKVPAAPEVPTLDVSDVLKNIADSKTLLDWYQVRLAYEATATENAEIDAALDAREKELATTSNPRPISEDLDLIDIDWQLSGNDISEEGRMGKFRVTWLFKVKESIPVESNQDIKLILRGWVDKSHQKHFEGDKRFVEFTYDLVPPVSEWKPGSYCLVQKATYSEIPNVPYRLYTFFSITKKSEEGKWTYLGPYGKSVDDGWHADAGEIPAPEPTATTTTAETESESVENSEDNGETTPSVEADESVAKEPDA